MEKFPTILIRTEILAAPDIDQRSHLLKQTQQPTGMHYKAPKGHAETQFERYLWQYFPTQIHTELMMLRPGYSQPYVPDFAYIDPTLNLHLDIEIDEPYTHDTRQPLHHLGATKDEQRNQFFLNARWVVIRFSEMQAVKTPTSCCKAIASTIASITQDNSIMLPFRQVPTLKPEPRWSYAEAQQMAVSAYRDQYLEPHPVVKPRKGRKARKSTCSPRSPRSIATSQLTFYCPACGEGPILWKGHYIACPNCQYDNFVL
jgi:very-short-patch-repair endonuclease